MIDWLSFFLGILQGTITSVIGGYVLLKFILPKIAAESAAHTIKAMKRDKEIAPIIDKAKEMVNTMEPLVKRLAVAFRNVDLDKLQKDIKPFIKAIKKIDPKTVDELMVGLKELTGAVKKTIEKPKIPKPED